MYSCRQRYNIHEAPTNKKAKWALKARQYFIWTTKPIIIMHHMDVLMLTTFVIYLFCIRFIEPKKKTIFKFCKEPRIQICCINRVRLYKPPFYCHLLNYREWEAIKEPLNPILTYILIFSVIDGMWSRYPRIYSKGQKTNNSLSECTLMLEDHRCEQPKWLLWCSWKEMKT